ncbi:FBD domain [Arabidopsis thaliana x Arabidopsis arenosa]|uniref:FBD domain n=1 Tax=Arabidopsis thaliana x Arabidopsis arenosa TaxID=1240361 RepID=A0A8T1ZLE2_9BRAS|nr:FBD domain [Arabidopsis thaliana x Arabidopsis arenosa]
MEQKCKIGGEGLRNGNVVNVDRISELPEALLLHILSSLPTETVIATSVLSKSWTSLWKMVPNLKFDSKYHHTFSENVCRSLISHRTPFLESLHLRIEDESDALDVGILIGIAFARHMRKFVLKFPFQEESYVRFPSAWCSCNDTLEILKLKYYILLDFPSLVCLKSLRKLHLYHVKFKDEESVCNLLCGCPSLEDLVVHRYSTIDVLTYTIVVPSLQRLTIYDDYYGEGVGGYVINAPSLKYLNIDGFNGLEFCLIEKAPELVEAKISDIFEIANENILESLTSAKRLSLHLPPLKIKYPIGKIFYQLLSLELRTFSYEWCNLLSFMLDSSPKLQILKLIDPYRFARDDCPVGWEWNEKEVATYILQCLIENAPELVEAEIIDVIDITNENILESLTSVKRLSLDLSLLEIKFPTGKIFYQLVYLELGTYNSKWWKLLSLMLDSSPVLQILKLNNAYLCDDGKGLSGLKWNPPKCVAECLLFHLEKLLWIGYEWQQGDEKEVATYILENARCLKKATFSTKRIDPDKMEKLEKRREMLNELANVSRASNSCHLVFDSI